MIVLRGRFGSGACHALAVFIFRPASCWLNRRYQEDGLVAHARLNDGSVLIFRGKDQKGRMALLHLSNPQPNKKEDGDIKITLTLSYIEKPEQPDAFQLKEDDF